MKYFNSAKYFMLTIGSPADIILVNMGKEVPLWKLCPLFLSYIKRSGDDEKIHKAGYY